MISHDDSLKEMSSTIQIWQLYPMTYMMQGAITRKRVISLAQGQVYHYPMSHNGIVPPSDTLSTRVVDEHSVPPDTALAAMNGKCMLFAGQKTPGVVLLAHAGDVAAYRNVLDTSFSELVDLSGDLITSMGRLSDPVLYRDPCSHCACIVHGLGEDKGSGKVERRYRSERDHLFINRGTGKLHIPEGGAEH